MASRSLLAAFPLSLLLVACGTSGKAGDGNRPLPPSSVPASDEQAFQALKESADAAGALDRAGAEKAYPTAFKTALDYDPLKAEYLDKIQASALALSDADKALLGKNGFVIATDREFPTFVRGFAEIYSEHLPVYVSADALLESVHRSYDTILLNVEEMALIPDVHALLSGMRTRLAASNADAKMRADVDLYLTVAIALLDGTVPSPVAGADSAKATSIVDAAVVASGIVDFELFGVPRSEDFSQFTPRGHYTQSPTLMQYFRAMIWLGRVDLRLIETQSDGSQVFHRDQFEDTVLVADLVGPDIDRWQRVDTTIRTFVGESDYMIVPEVGKLVADLGGPAAAHAATDDAVVTAIAVGGYGKQQIASHLMVNDGTVSRLPLNRSFLIFGQRYIVDSHVFSEAVYDRIPGRMMPDPLDAAFAAFGNNQALTLDPDVATVPALPGALSRMRVLIDSHDDAFWESNFYNLWLRSLRALSPAPNVADPSAVGLPEVAGTEAWGRRILNAQLGSWAELRHDTLLYAKQSYTGIPSCEFPDAYVDPYPDAFGAIRKYAAAGGRIADIASHADASFGAGVASYFDALESAASLLEKMAAQERRGEPFTPDELAFINDAVRIEQVSVVCATVDTPNGWLAHLFFEPAQSIEFAPTIADVHTQPADAGGTIVGKVLHVGTGYPRMMVATIDTCVGPRAYAGVVFAYHEDTTKDFERLTDEKWAERFTVGAARPADVPWLAPVLGK